MPYDWLVVGAGFTGATLAERLASELDQKVLVVDRRPHIAGNAWDGPGPSRHPIHHYGAHIFHTVSTRVWNYLSRFTEWRPYEHRVLGAVDGRLVPIPFNLTSLHALLPAHLAGLTETRLLSEYGPDCRVPILKLIEHPDPVIRDFGEYVYEKVFAKYSAKQWGLRPDELDRSVTGRVPVVLSHDDRYFHDRYQAMPSRGYSVLFSNMLRHPNIDLSLQTDYLDVEAGDYRRVIFTGPIDEYFGYCFGHLPYRSLRFEHDLVNRTCAQPVAVINYPNADGYTRVLEHKHLTGHTGTSTVLTTEWPQAHVAGVTDPYYPIPREDNRRLHEQYRKLASDTSPLTVFAGRLADYKYYNMDQAVSRALLVFRSIAAKELGVLQA